MPGRKSRSLYWPAPSVTTERVPSISAGLAASIVTPGSTAPLASLTTPAKALWAELVPGNSTRHAALTKSETVAYALLPNITTLLGRPRVLMTHDDTGVSPLT